MIWMSGAVIAMALGLPERAGAGEGPAADDDATTAEAILATAFANRYEVDLTSKIELVMRDGSGQERKRVFQAASKLVDDRVHSVGRLIWPHHLRGMTILSIEARDRNHEAFVYLPSLDKVRRVTTAQRGDSFLGSDVTYEDLERRRVENYDLGPIERSELGGEVVYVIPGRPLREFSYSHVVFLVARADGAMLETRYFKRGAEEPFRVISAPRETMVRQDEHVIPTRLTVYNRIRGTSTEVRFDDLRINPPIDEHVFTVTALELQRKLPDHLE
jgi:hypothetical protein